MPPQLAKDASLVLIGMRCVGKSTLAAMAAKALKWKVVDEKRYFQKATGYTLAEYIEKYGINAYCAKEVTVLREILAEHPTGCTVVCSSSCIQTQAGCELLRQHLSSLPVVHVMRDGDVLQSQLEGRWDGDVRMLRRKQDQVFRCCSNLTFFNVDASLADLQDVSYHETGSKRLYEAVPPVSERPNAVSLSLKHVEFDFLRFLEGVYGREEDTDSSVSSEPTYALQLPLSRFKHSGINLEWIECCADLLEVHVDKLMEGYMLDSTDQSWWEYISDQLAVLRRHTRRPIIYRVGKVLNDPHVTEPDSFDLLQLGLRLAVEYVAVDLREDEYRIHKLVASKGHSKIIGWFHDGEPVVSGGWAGSNRLEWYQRAQSLGCDAVRLTQTALTLHDNAAAQSFAFNLKSTESMILSAYNTGRLGRPSQCFNSVLTAVRHPDVTNDDSESITIPQAEAALYASLAHEKLKFYVIGASVSYSVAPVLNNTAFNAYGMPHFYSVMETKSLEAIEDQLRAHGLGGLGVSAPFKTSIIPRLHSMSCEARSIGAVNTILPVRCWTAAPVDGQRGDFHIPTQRNRAGPVLALYGENTDWVGIKTCVLRHLSPANAITSLSTALIIGAGGMARAAVYAMIRSGFRYILIYNRTQTRAEDLVRHFEALQHNGNMSFQPVTMSVLKTPDQSWPSGFRMATVIINCSPVDEDGTATQSSHSGLQPAVSVPDAWLKSPTGGVYLELAYNNTRPSEELVRICSREERNWVGVTGLEVIIEVASAQFEFWQGRKAPTLIMQTELDRVFRDRGQVMAQHSPTDSDHLEEETRSWNS